MTNHKIKISKFDEADSNSSQNIKLPYKQKDNSILDSSKDLAVLRKLRKVLRSQIKD